MFSLCTGISLYFLISWLFWMGSHWRYENAYCCHFLIKQFQMGGDHLPLVSVSLYILVFPYIFYFLIFSNKLTVSNGFSLMVWKHIAVTFSSSSFKWGGTICLWYLYLIYTGISLYFLISWLFQMGSHWQYENAYLSLSRQAVSNGGDHLPLVSPCFLCSGISLYLPIIWLFRMGAHWLHWKA